MVRSSNQFYSFFISFFKKCLKLQALDVVELFRSRPTTLQQLLYYSSLNAVILCPNWNRIEFLGILLKYWRIGVQTKSLQVRYYLRLNHRAKLRLGGDICLFSFFSTLPLPENLLLVKYHSNLTTNWRITTSAMLMLRKRMQWSTSWELDAVK